MNIAKMAKAQTLMSLCLSATLFYSQLPHISNIIIIPFILTSIKDKRIGKYVFLRYDHCNIFGRKLMSTSSIHPLIIIGSGPAGYSAAVYAARAGLENP